MLNISYHNFCYITYLAEITNCIEELKTKFKICIQMTVAKTKELFENHLTWGKCIKNVGGFSRLFECLTCLGAQIWWRWSYEFISSPRQQKNPEVRYFRHFRVCFKVAHILPIIFPSIMKDIGTILNGPPGCLPMGQPST